jgi:hypothetical protein
MTAPKVSIKMPSQRSILQRIKGLREIEARVINSRPEPFYGEWTGVKLVKPPKCAAPEGKKWTQMRFAVQELVQESEDLLTLTRSFARVNASKRKKEDADGAGQVSVQ